MSSPAVSASPTRLGSPLGAPIYPRHVELSKEEIALKDRRESAGMLTTIRPPAMASDGPAAHTVTPFESSYLWYVPVPGAARVQEAHRTVREALRVCVLPDLVPQVFKLE